MAESKMSSNYVQSKKQSTDPKSKLTMVFDEYKELLRDKTHPDNQTKAYTQNVITTLNRLVSAADELDNVNPGEGIFGLIILTLRANLALKDEVIKLEYELKEQKNEINRIKKGKI